MAETFQGEMAPKLSPLTLTILLSSDDRVTKHRHKENVVKDYILSHVMGICKIRLMHDKRFNWKCANKKHII